MLYVGVDTAKIRLLQLQLSNFMGRSSKIKEFLLRAEHDSHYREGDWRAQKLPVCSYPFYTKDLEHIAMTFIFLIFPGLS
jgi:hypothetical protein